MSLLNSAEKWIEKIGEDFIHHHRVNDFTVVTRPATDGEKLAFLALQDAESDIAKVKETIDTLVAENNRLSTQVAAAAEPFTAKIEALEAQVSDMGTQLTKMADEKTAAVEENNELKETITTLHDQMVQLSVAKQNASAASSEAPPAPAPAAGDASTQPAPAADTQGSN